MNERTQKEIELLIGKYSLLKHGVSNIVFQVNQFMKIYKLETSSHTKGERQLIKYLDDIMRNLEECLKKYDMESDE